MSIKKVALDALKTKFEGVDEKVLTRIAAKIAKTAKTEDDATSEVEDMTLQSVIDSYTDSRVTDAQAKAVQTYEEKHGLKDGKPKEVGDDADDDDNEGGEGNGKGKGGADETPAYVKALMKSVEALTQEVSTLKAGKTADARKAQLNETLKDVDERTRKMYERNFARMQFKDDADFDSWIDEVTSDIEESGNGGGSSQQQQQQQSSAQGKPKGGAGSTNNTISAEVQSRIDARKAAAETQTSAIKGL